MFRGVFFHNTQESKEMAEYFQAAEKGMIDNIRKYVENPLTSWNLGCSRMGLFPVAYDGSDVDGCLDDTILGVAMNKRQFGIVLYILDHLDVIFSKRTRLSKDYIYEYVLRNAIRHDADFLVAYLVNGGHIDVNRQFRGFTMRPLNNFVGDSDRYAKYHEVDTYYTDVKGVTPFFLACKHNATLTLAMMLDSPLLGSVTQKVTGMETQCSGEEGILDSTFPFSMTPWSKANADSKKIIATKRPDAIVGKYNPYEPPASSCSIL